MPEGKPAASHSPKLLKTRTSSTIPKQDPESLHSARLLNGEMFRLRHEWQEQANRILPAETAISFEINGFDVLRNINLMLADYASLIDFRIYQMPGDSCYWVHLEYRPGWRVSTAMSRQKRVMKIDNPEPRVCKHIPGKDERVIGADHKRWACAAKENGP